MHLKQNGYCVGVLLIYSITTITLPPVGRCERTVQSSQPNSHVALHHDRNRVLTTGGPAGRSNREGTEQRQSRNLLYLHYLENRDGTQTKTSGGRPEQTLKPRMASTDPEQTEGERMYTSFNPPNEHCSDGEMAPVVHGKFYIKGQLEANTRNVGYQSDAVVSGQERIRGQRVRGSEESWRRLQPLVECGDDGMTLTVRRRQAVQLLLNRVNESSVPLSQLPPQCGYSVETTWRDLSLMAQYDACHVLQEDGKYTLSLQIGEKTFTLACPLSLPEELPLTHQPLIDRPHHLSSGPTEHMPQSLEPFPWAPPFYLAPPYYPHPTYHRKYPSPGGHDAYDLPTPSSSTPDPTFGPQPLPVDPQPDYQDFYSHQIPRVESYKRFTVHSSLSSADDMEDSRRVYPGLQQKQETPVFGLSEKHSPTQSSDTGFPIQFEAPPPQPPSHAFNQYYHYYHHPKIPLPGPPQDPDPGLEVPSLTNPHNPEFPVLPRSTQQSKAISRVNSDWFLPSVPEAASRPYTLATNSPSTAYPPQPYPYHYFDYFPHIARGEAKRSAPLNPDTAAKANLSYQNVKSSPFVQPLPRSSVVHDKYNLNPYMDQPRQDKMINFKRNGPESIKQPLWSDDEAELDSKIRHSAVQPYPPEQDVVAVPPSSTFPTPSPNHNPPHPYFYYPYHHYQMDYGPESLLSADNPVPPTLSEEALDPLLQAFSSPPQHPFYYVPQTPLTKSMYDVSHGPLHPYHHYYHLYYHPDMSVDNQKVHPAGSMNSKSESQLLSDYSQMDQLGHAAEAGNPSIPQSSPFHSLYSHYITQQQPFDAFGQPGGEEAEEGLDNEMKDHIKANPYTPSASLCGLGLMSDFDCSCPSGCCLYHVKDCTMGQHLIFAMPDCVVEPTVAPPAHPSEVNNASCTLQRLTSDPNIYTVPLDGCGVNKHAFGQTVVHLLEVHGIYSLQDHSSVYENSPVRLMVECSSSPGSPGEVRLHVMDQPPPPPVQATPAMVTVQLRIATDESFTSFHPEAHLPLSHIQGSPVYVEVSLLDPPEPSLVLLVHSCLAYTQTPYTSWMLVYDGCPSKGDAQPLSSPRSLHIRRIMISTFLSLHVESPSYPAKGAYSHLEDPEIFFMCLTEVCSAADGDCTVGCISSKLNYKGETEESSSSLSGGFLYIHYNVNTCGF
ncbi:uncharacterized protein LOC127356523 isoform X3 [Dicentrarchus labrax]|uniref:uncharacterized protein LOC127356523 isoform X3 n=1 Tax=Dicentrarchus labrax TaxID=13489 RepID=UPI0021F5C860|nr:uncharacterized protein LOC127356523 isoform X3 [Dicentrarchus labrax]